jgi:hypothetical protein
MVKILAFLTKREDIQTRAFIEYYENHHVPLICSMAPTPSSTSATTLCGATNSTRRRRHARLRRCDRTGISRPGRLSRLVRRRRDGAPGEQVAPDELKFLDPSRTRAYVTEEHMAVR